MVELLKKNEHKWTNMILIVITLAIAIYVAYIKGFIPIGYINTVVLEEGKELIPLDVKEKSYVGVNNRQVFKVTGDGITAYSLEGDEIWRDTFSLSNFVVMQKQPYIAVASKQGNTVLVFNEKGRKSEITSDYPIVYFSVNESGGVVIITNDNNSYTVSAYSEVGQHLWDRTSFISDDGYPLVAELSPDNKHLIVSYASVDEPKVVSRILGMDINDSNNEVKDNVQFGQEQKNNLVYEIEFINNETWAAIGDKMIVWYDVNGNEKGKQQNLSLVFTPYLYKMSEHGTGYLPMILSEKPTQNIVHRQDELAYYNDIGEKTFSLALDGGAEYCYADSNGVIVQVGNQFKGYNKLGNEIFEYTSNTDVSKVIYIDSARVGIAVDKERVLLLTVKKGGE